jgi:D-glycero-D-manno-heptose 1,7-bisphosphate phosphatase
MKHYDLILLDRDGVINFDDEGYISHPDKWTAIPGSLEAIARLNQAGKKVAVVSNQSGINRGLFTEQQLQTVHQKMRDELTRVGGHLDQIFYCPHRPDEHCNCRKPKTELLVRAQNQFKIAKDKMLIIGDAECDLLLGQAFGCDAHLVLTGHGQMTLSKQGTAPSFPVHQNLEAAVNFILGHHA